MSIPRTSSVDLLTGTMPSEQSVGVTSTTLGLEHDVSMRQLLTVQFVRTGGANGTSTFRIDGSNDGTNWTTSLALEDAQSTTPTTRVTSSVISGASGAKAYYIPPIWRYVRAYVEIDVDGKSYAFLQAGG